MCVMCVYMIYGCLMCMCSVCAYMFVCMCAIVHVWRSEVNLWVQGLTFHLEALLFMVSWPTDLWGPSSLHLLLCLRHAGINRCVLLRLASSGDSDTFLHDYMARTSSTEP